MIPKVTTVKVPLDSAGLEKRQLLSSTSSQKYWSWTLLLVSFPFVLWGYPIYLVALRNLPNEPIPRSTGAWLKRVFNCRLSPFICILSLILLVPTLMVDAHFTYSVYRLFDSLFISGKFELTFFGDALVVLRAIPIVLPLNYMWLRGFVISNVMNRLNQTYQTYGGVGTKFHIRLRLFIMMVLICGVHVIRYYTYEKYSFQETKDFQSFTKTLFSFSVDIFCSLTLTLYCAFCYAIKFELFASKAYIYTLLKNRVPPNSGHLSQIKRQYTHAADHVVAINSLFSAYMSMTILFLLIGMVYDADNFWGMMGSVLTGGSLIKLIIDIFFKGLDDGEKSSEEKLSSSEIREINADIACIIAVYALIYYTVRQAVAANDAAREIHVWLNDLVTGGGGTDVKGVLQELGAEVDEDEEPDERLALVWAGNRQSGSGISDEFLEKFRMLKAYVHVRMQVEKPALLTIALVGLFLPSLGGRLRNYRVKF